MPIKNTKLPIPRALSKKLNELGKKVFYSDLYQKYIHPHTRLGKLQIKTQQDNQDAKRDLERAEADWRQRGGEQAKRDYEVASRAWANQKIGKGVDAGQNYEFVINTSVPEQVVDVIREPRTKEELIRGNNGMSEIGDIPTGKKIPITVIRDNRFMNFGYEVPGPEDGHYEKRMNGSFYNPEEVEVWVPTNYDELAWQLEDNPSIMDQYWMAKFKAYQKAVEDWNENVRPFSTRWWDLVLRSSRIGKGGYTVTKNDKGEWVPIVESKEGE